MSPITGMIVVLFALIPVLCFYLIWQEQKRNSPRWYLHLLYFLLLGLYVWFVGGMAAVVRSIHPVEYIAGERGLFWDTFYPLLETQASFSAAVTAMESELASVRDFILFTAEKFRVAGTVYMVIAAIFLAAGLGIVFYNFKKRATPQLLVLVTFLACITGAWGNHQYVFGQRLQKNLERVLHVQMCTLKEYAAEKKLTLRSNKEMIPLLKEYVKNTPHTFCEEWVPLKKVIFTNCKE